MMNQQLPSRYHSFTTLGRAGTVAAVDELMHNLLTHDDFATSRMVDFALSLVDTREGEGRLRHYLFHGVLIQRNYAALYFKRRGRVALLDEAVVQGKIDAVQAYSR